MLCCYLYLDILDSRKSLKQNGFTIKFMFVVHDDGAATDATKTKKDEEDCPGPLHRDVKTF